MRAAACLGQMSQLATAPTQVRKAYREVPYHNFFHCVDVTHATYRFIALVSRAVALTQAERLALMLAALCHDMEHPGPSCLLFYSSLWQVLCRLWFCQV